MDVVNADLRSALRSLARSPVYVAMSVLALAIGIGSTTAAFSVVRGVLLKPLPYPGSDRLVAVLSASPASKFAPSYPDFVDLRAGSDLFAGMAFIRGEGVTLRRSTGAEIVAAASVSPDFFPLLAITPMIGRTLSAADDQPNAPPVAVLTYQFWTRDFAGDPHVIGKSLELSTGTCTIVGVLRRGQSYPDWAGDFRTDFYRSLNAQPNVVAMLAARRGLHADARAIARLQPGVTLAQARARLASISAQLSTAYPATDSGLSATVRPLREDVLGDVAPSLRILAIAVALVLLLTCADVANLALIRAMARSRELAVRAALGAGRARVARYLFVESAVLAAVGGTLGVMLAAVAVRVLARATSTTLPRLDEITLDWPSVVVTVTLAVLAAVLCALAPVLAIGRGDLVSALKSGRGTGGGARVGRQRLTVRGGIVTAQLALAVVLVAGAGLMIKSFGQIRRGDRGFDPSHLVLWRLAPPPVMEQDTAALVSLYRRAIAAARLPGVESASIVNHPPISFSGIRSGVGADGASMAADSVGALYVTVMPDYFATARIPLLRGRLITEGDLSSNAVAAVVSRRAAEHYWPNTDPIGHRIRVTAHADTVDATIVGIVGDIKRGAATEPPEPIVYLPITRPAWGAVWVVARTTGAPGAMLPTLRRAFAALDPDLPLSMLETGPQALDAVLVRERVTMSILGAFSAMALLLAALGLYGVVSYAVAQRVPEFGIRMALGAPRRAITGLVGSQIAILVGTGLVIGVAGAVWLARAMRGLLYGVSSLDPTTFAEVALLLAAVACVAGYLPARRAVRVDPATALRAE
jgi:putative ABC transport system permease protein